jgi:hypothetical protein
LADAVLSGAGLAVALGALGVLDDFSGAHPANILMDSNISNITLYSDKARLPGDL